ncbi:FCD domain-containing protein [Halovulum dunhuangense]|uniref:Pyruvate dehydrogenase complex repressor n=1 Tax=Halovulum dunhuangense TaxID=1505036 RepID=A0A849KV87_9RHOB|nr:FCD domain-containing protein [Halovulum dunhuangense]NNU79561.1 FCD domain-containing protein [Halovulum dunhuangense]
MTFHKIEPERIASAIRRQIESLILRGVLRPGARLPAERDLAAQLSVSRPSLREALAELEQAGLIVTRPGAGAYVADVLGSAFAPPLVRLFSTHSEALFDYIAFRRDLEGLAAARAAREASDTDLSIITAIFQRMEAAHARRAAREEAALDADFHMAIVEASHNVVMLHMMRSMFEMLREGVFYNRQTMFAMRTTRSELLQQHRAIHDAVTGRDPAAARAAVEAHMDFVESATREQIRIARNEDTAQLRFAQEQAK